MLIKYLPREAATVTAINGGDQVWSSIEHLLADLWTVLVKANSDPKRTPDDLDHPARAAMTRKVRSANKQKLKALFLARKYAKYREGEVI